MTVTEVPFFRPSIGSDEIDAVATCLRSGWLTTGPECAAFEKDFADFMGGGVHALAVTSATAALHLGLEALGVRPGDEVILPTLTFTATAAAVRYLGATPVLVDVDAESLCMTPGVVASAITDRTRVIMPVHFAGRSCDMTGLRALADQHGLHILDDAAHALPTHHKESLIGSEGALADATAFSFYANKTITTGEGGMLVTRDAQLAERARKMRLHGIDRDVLDRFTNVRAGWVYDVITAGYKYNLTDLAAAIGRVQLAKAEMFRQTRARLAERYDEALSDLPLKLPPRPARGDVHSWHLYIVRLSDDAPLSRDDFIQELNSKGVGTSVHYRPLHQMTYWREMTSDRSYPVADDHFSRCVSLPLFMEMTHEEQELVIDAIRRIFGC